MLVPSKPPLVLEPNLALYSVPFLAGFTPKSVPQNPFEFPLIHSMVLLPDGTTAGSYGTKFGATLVLICN